MEHEGARLVLDAGLPLDAPLDQAQSLPAVRGLAQGDPSLLGLVVTHGHPDHYGLVGSVHPSVPVVIGEATQRVLKEALFFSPAGADLNASDYLRDREPLCLGPFTVTPYLVDHSAFDAYALLVEAGGKRLFYSGDLRAHGRKANLFERLLKDAPSAVDALLLEGTTLGRAPSAGLSERDVEGRCTEIFAATEGLALVSYSAQNLDRVVSLYRAAKRGGRVFVMDLYTATMTRATGLSTIPQATWDGIEVFVPLSQRIKVKGAKEFNRTASVRSARVYPEQLAARASELVLTFRLSMARELASTGCLDGARAVWSLWPGYLDRPSGLQLRSWLGQHDIPLEVVHSSGHATPADLKRLSLAIDAKQVVPVHTADRVGYEALHRHVRLHDDGDWWSL